MGGRLSKPHANDVARVRHRPGMYIGGLEDGSGILDMILELVANAYDQHLAGRCTRIDVDVAGDGTITVSDDGPGLSIDGDNHTPPLSVVLTTLSELPTVDGHQPHVHMGFGGAGLCVVNALSERFELMTVSRGVEATATFAAGHALEPIRTVRAVRKKGTTVRFRPDSVVFQHVRPPRDLLTSKLEALPSWRLASS